MSDLRLEIYVRDMAASVDFYTRVLGFESQVSGYDTYRPLVRGPVRIALQHVDTMPSDHRMVAPGPRGTGIELVLEVDDVEGLAEHVAQVWELDEAIQRRDWGLTDFRVVDPDGYYWRPTSRD